MIHDQKLKPETFFVFNILTICGIKQKVKSNMLIMPNIYILPLFATSAV